MSDGTKGIGGGGGDEITVGEDSEGKTGAGRLGGLRGGLGRVNFCAFAFR